MAGASLHGNVSEKVSDQLVDGVQEALGVSDRVISSCVAEAILASKSQPHPRGVIVDRNSGEVIFIDTKKAILAGAALLAPAASIVVGSKLQGAAALIGALAVMGGMKFKTRLSRPCATICLLLLDAPERRMSAGLLQTAFLSTPGSPSGFDQSSWEESLGVLTDLGLLDRSGGDVRLRSRVRFRRPTQRTENVR